MSEAQHARGVEAARGFAARLRAARRRRFLAVGGATAAMGVAAFLLVPGLLHRMQESAPPLALEVESGAIGAAGAIVAHDNEQAALRFGDGTIIKLGS